MIGEHVKQLLEHSPALLYPEKSKRCGAKVRESYRKWSVDEMRILYEGVKQGKTCNELSRELNYRSVWAIQHKIREQKSRGNK